MSLYLQSNDSQAHTLNWSQPWLRHLPYFCHELKPKNLVAQLAHAQSLSENPLKSVKNSNNKTVRFVPQAALPENTAYEQYIFETGNIPTRNNLHDLFNACVWFTFPQTKCYLNAMQAQEILKDGIKNKRGRVRDLITLFDENRAILVTSNNDIATELNRFNWQDALVSSRKHWNIPYKQSENAEAEVYIFGHALLEQLVQPRKPLCAHTLTVIVPQDWFKQTLIQKKCDLDKRLQLLLKCVINDSEFTTKNFQPLPILGVPYFWKPNKDLAFYQDEFVFRKGRRKQAKT